MKLGTDSAKLHTILTWICEQVSDVYFSFVQSERQRRGVGFSRVRFGRMRSLAKNLARSKSRVKLHGAFPALITGTIQKRLLVN